jgi:hypothetical protein
MLIVMLRFANQMLGGYFNVFLIFPADLPRLHPNIRKWREKVVIYG